jgi:two-component system, OmpR family, phosphate regulon sensor histidine kinase PhoR
MRRMLNRTSFTARLVAIAAGILAVLVIVDYVALLEVPSRVARDTVEIALRENVQSLNATFREDRARLDGETKPFVERLEVRRAILRQDRAALERFVAEQVGGDVRFQIRSGTSEQPFSGTGPIVSEYAIRGQENSADIAFYRIVNDEVLDRAAATAGNDSPFALERNNRFLARSADFPDEIDPSMAGGALEPDVAVLKVVRVDGEQLHLYSRALTTDPSYQLHALSTAELEDVALREIRGDVRTAIGGMTFATVAGFLLFIFATNHTMRGFAGRVATLADGDYGTRLAVHGSDGFAALSSSVNRLSAQLAEQVGQLEATAQAFGRTLETLEEGICVWDDSAQVTFWNRGAEQLTGLPRERATVDDPVIGFLRAERAPGTRRVTLPVRRAGSGLVVDLVVTAMPGGGVLQTFRDTTMADLLQQTQRNFMATAAHELRTPITTILGFSDTLVNPELELTDRQREEFVSIIRDHAYQLQEIADAFFTNHQLANERVEVAIVPTRLAVVLDDVLDRVRTSFPDRRSQIDAIAVDIPPDATVLADRRALIGVATVLVENALKYGSDPISITSEQSGGTVTLLVRDQGQGIESHHHGRLFDPFYRVDVDMRSGVGGAGLGLFTARKLVEAMHGSIRVLSAPGSGATFVVDLPACPAELDDSGNDKGGGSRLRLVG